MAPRKLSSENVQKPHSMLIFLLPFPPERHPSPGYYTTVKVSPKPGDSRSNAAWKKRQLWHLPTIQTWSLATRSGQKRPSETQLRSRRSFRISALPQCLSAAAGPVREDAKVSRGPPNYFLIPLHGATLASNTHVRMLALADKSKEQFRCHFGALPYHLSQNRYGGPK